MENMEDSKFYITDIYGNEKELTAISLIDDEENNLHYVVYADESVDSDNLPKIYVSEIVKDENGITLQEVENIEEVDLITKQLDLIINEYLKKQKA